VISLASKRDLIKEKCCNQDVFVMGDVFNG
jgi:hypothetical protein